VKFLDYFAPIKPGEELIFVSPNTNSLNKSLPEQYQSIFNHLVDYEFFNWINIAHLFKIDPSTRTLTFFVDEEADYHEYQEFCQILKQADRGIFTDWQIENPEVNLSAFKKFSENFHFNFLIKDQTNRTLHIFSHRDYQAKNIFCHHEDLTLKEFFSLINDLKQFFTVSSLAIHLTGCRFPDYHGYEFDLKKDGEGRIDQTTKYLLPVTENLSWVIVNDHTEKVCDYRDYLQEHRLPDLQAIVEKCDQQIDHLTAELAQCPDPNLQVLVGKDLEIIEVEGGAAHGS